MTETAAMIAATRVEEFGATEAGGFTVLPHANVSLSPAGTIRVKGSSIFRGYFPELHALGEFETHDLGRLDPTGRLHVLGRRDAAIISGGKKVQPEEVEAALQASGFFTDVAVAGVPDREWGEIVVAFYPAHQSAPDREKLAEVLANRLAVFKHPKRYVAIAEWPRNAQGKLNRAKLLVDQRRV
jgi:O-succinylbenzoic acid--CoA ligase